MHLTFPNWAPADDSSYGYCGAFGAYSTVQCLVRIPVKMLSPKHIFYTRHFPLGPSSHDRMLQGSARTSLPISAAEYAEPE